MTPPGSSRNSRSDSEPRSVYTPERNKDVFSTPQSTLRAVSEGIVTPAVLPPLSSEYVTPMTHRTTTTDGKDRPVTAGQGENNEAALMAAKRELFLTPIKGPGVEFKTPSLKEWQEANSRQLDRQNSARMEARAKAQAKPDQDLGLSPPDYIENLKDKLRRKPSVDEDPPGIPIRTRSFSESNHQVELLPPRTISEIPPAKPPRMILPPTSMSPARLESPRISTTSTTTTAALSGQQPYPLKSSKSMSQMVTPSIQPSSPRSDVIGSLFLAQQGGAVSSPSAASPPHSPRSSKSTSYLWAGLSPAESQAKLDAESTSASASTPSTTNEVCCQSNSNSFNSFFKK